MFRALCEWGQRHAAELLDGFRALFLARRPTRERPRKRKSSLLRFAGNFAGVVKTNSYPEPATAVRSAASRRAENVEA